jgi:CHAT domain-containing protein
MSRFETIICCCLLLALSACSESSPALSSSEPAALTTEDSVRLSQKAAALLERIQADGTPTEQVPQLLDTVLACYQNLQQPAAWVDALWLYCGHFSGQGDLQSAHDLLEKSIRQAWWGEDGRKGRLYFWQGFILRRLGRNYAAVAYLEKAKILSEQHGNVVEGNPAGPIYKTLANIKTRLGENEEAEKLFQAALDLLQGDTIPDHAISNGFTQADIHSDLGIVFQNAGNPGKALEAYENGLKVLENMQVQDPQALAKLTNTRGMLLSNKAGALALLGRWPEADRVVHVALSTLNPDKINYRFSALNILADIQEQTGSAEIAQQTQAKALALAQESGDKVETREHAKLLNTMGWAACRRQDYQTAVQHAHTALHLLYPNLPPDDLRRNPDPAIFDPAPENTVAEALDMKGEALWQLYQATQEPDWLRQADSATALAILMMENLRDAAVYESSKLTSSGQSRTLFGRMLRILYAEQVAGDETAARRAFEFSEKSKAVLLHQKVAADAALKAADVADSLIQQERDLKEQWAHLRNQRFQRQVAQENPNDSIVQNLNKRLYRIEEQQRNLRKSIADRYALSPDGRDAKTASAAEVQERLLRDGERWINYYTDQDSGWVYLVSVDKNSVGLTRRPYRDDAVQTFLQLFNSAQTAENRSGDPVLWAEFAQQSRQLYETLVQPALPAGRVPHRLALSPDGALALLPFDLLLCRPPAPEAPIDYSKLPYLALESQTRLSPSASLELFYADQPRGTHKGAYIGFAPDYSNSVLGQVVSGAKVVQDAAEAFEGRAFVGQSAGLDTFLQQAGGYAILHFHGHAEASDSFPDYSWMAFTAGKPRSPGEPPMSYLPMPAEQARTLGRRPGRMPVGELENCLFAHQIYHAQLGADLVLLSACQTGLGKIALGEGTLSLSRAFQAAGCPATVMSLWEVRDDATAELMHLFLANIRAGQDKDEALANAKHTYLQAGKNVFPYYWAGFVLTGNTDPVQLPGNSWVRYGLLLLLLCSGVVAVVRRFFSKSA